MYGHHPFEEATGDETVCKVFEITCTCMYSVQCSATTNFDRVAK